MRECTHPRPSLQHHMSHDLIILTWPPVSCLVVQGHSIGGSLATLLMLMYVRRGVLSQESLATVYTFGAPAVFCQGETEAALTRLRWECCAASASFL